MKPRQAFDAEREEAAALPRPARRDPALAMAKRQVLVLLGAWLAVRALLMPAALLAGPQNADFWISGAVGLAVSVLVAAFILSGMRALAGLAMLAMAVSAVQTVPALLEYFSYGGGPAAYAALFLAGQAAQLGLLAVCFSCPVRSGISVCAGGTEKTLNNYQNPARICKRNRVRLFFEL